MPGGHRGVRRKDCGPAYFLESRTEALAPVHHLADSLKGYKSRVTFVQMPDRWLVAHCSKRPDTADAQYNLLLEPCFAVAAIKSCRKLAIRRHIFLDGCV